MESGEKIDREKESGSLGSQQKKCKGSKFAETQPPSKNALHLYIHIPFCKQACHYCDFHFSTNLNKRREIVDAIAGEIIAQKDYLRESVRGQMPENRLPLETVYLGGGTPSLLEEEDFLQIFNTLDKYFHLLPGAEVTLEANPDDLTPEKLRLFRQFPINRLSIGIQSFDESHLRYLNRAHNATQAEDCVGLARLAGFENISIDLIYAIPAEDHRIWQSDLERAIQLGVTHISSYCLTIEPQTTFGKWLERGKIKAVEEEFAARQFEILVDYLHRHGFEQYEISNFAQPGCYSRHNTSYWQQKPYLGVGPSAHSYNGTHRQYNISSNALYLKILGEGRIPSTVEVLSRNDLINEYVMISLRTYWGCDTRKILREYRVDLLQVHQAYLQQCLQKELLVLAAGVIRLSTKGKLLADQIASDLFLVE
jgi:oxygen-independent coproporphyrinogen-3 oxidase